MTTPLKGNDAYPTIRRNHPFQGTQNGTILDVAIENKEESSLPSFGELLNE